MKDIIGDILDGRVVVVRGLGCRVFEAVSRAWYKPRLLEIRWRRVGWSDIIWMVGKANPNIGVGLSPT